MNRHKKVGKSPCSDTDHGRRLLRLARSRKHWKRDCEREPASPCKCELLFTLACDWDEHVEERFCQWHSKRLLFKQNRLIRTAKFSQSILISFQHDWCAGGGESYSTPIKQWSEEAFASEDSGKVFQSYQSYSAGKRLHCWLRNNWDYRASCPLEVKYCYGLDSRRAIKCEHGDAYPFEFTSDLERVLNYSTVKATMAARLINEARQNGMKTV